VEREQQAFALADEVAWVLACGVGPADVDVDELRQRLVPGGFERVDEATSPRLRRVVASDPEPASSRAGRWAAGPAEPIVAFPCGRHHGTITLMVGNRLAIESLLWQLNETERKFAPPELFVAGEPDLLRAGPCVAIVGSRKASAQGINRARKLADLLTQRGVIVISGLAAGIDTAAHETAIACGGRTIAVLGTPLDECFPAQNRALQTRIMREHLVVSQFAPGTRVGRHTFPMRNRTMALIADATVIIEATDQSGTINQGWEALRLGRPLWIAASLFGREDLTFPDELAFYGAEALTDEALPRLMSQLPEGRRDEPAELPF